MSFVIIVRRTLADDGGDPAAEAEETSGAQAAGCSAVRILRGLGGSRNLFAVSDWSTQAAARQYMEHMAQADPALVVKADLTELRTEPQADGSVRKHVLLVEAAAASAAA